jgi:cation diffusion facilitator family transporter
MSSSSKKSSVALGSVFASAIMTIGKLIVGLLTGSMGILSEAAHSLLDLGAALLTFFAVRFGDRPADESHHYGHGKIESVSALVETGLLFVTSAWIIYEAVHRLVAGKTEVEITWYAFAVIIASIIIDFTRSRALMKVAKETNSQALEADALHFKSDILSSCVVLFGLILSLAGVKNSDTFAAIGVSMFVLHAGWQLGRRTIDTLIDTAPLGIAEKAREIMIKVPGVLDAERVRARAYGAATFIDAEVIFDRNLTLVQTHNITTQIRQQISTQLPGADITIHAKPYKKPT